MRGRSTLPVALACGLALAACAKESRTLSATPPQSPPNGPSDPRIADYLQNAYQVNQGGRYFSWYGCSGCHDASDPDLRAAKLPIGVPFDAIFRAIANGHGRLAYGARVPVEQLWQLTAYVADLPQHTPDKRQRQNADGKGEPVGASWSGPLR